MKIINEFKEFAIKGNMTDMAVGIIIGGAFGKIVTSLVNDVIMPPIGIMTGSVDFADKAIVLKNATESATAVTLNYGVFINNLIDFFIVAFVIFIVIKQINRLRRREEEAPEEKKVAPIPQDIKLLTEIRDSLRK
ncbi:large-conductance mechanosensitive channel protein MscL [Candidatus Parcubacteria bacterium]|nr:large-conductance mechanosensitive channel protein MscL [Candidatus Parcubacteria bacterium]